MEGRHILVPFHCIPEDLGKHREYGEWWDESQRNEEELQGGDQGYHGQQEEEEESREEPFSLLAKRGKLVASANHHLPYELLYGQVQDYQ